MRFFYTSDLHFDDEKVSALRGFDHPLLHDEAISENWVQQVGKKDVVWVLGDLSIASGRARVEAVLEQIKKLPGIKHLVAGNHDKAHPLHRDSHNWQRTYLDTFASVQPFSRHKIGGKDVMLSHFPYAGDHTEVDRYSQYRLRDEGLPLLHGHTHQSHIMSFAGDRTESRLPGGSQIHVGWDAWFTPVDRDWIETGLA